MRNKGITLVALVITIIILLILAGIVIGLAIGKNGIMERAKNSTSAYKESEAREKLELVLLDMQAEKLAHSNEYDKDQYLTKKIEQEGMIVIDDIVIVDGWQFVINRDVPEIEEGLGKGKVNEDIKIVIGQTVSPDYTKSTLKVEIEYGGEISLIKVASEEIAIPEKQNGKYVIEKDVINNGTYNILVKDVNGGYQTEKKQITELTDDMEIWTKADLELFRDRVNAGRSYEGKNLKVMANIDLEGSQDNQWLPIGNLSKPFKGTFDGNGKEISNVYYNNSNATDFGLFGVLSIGTIKNLKVKNSTFIGKARGGAICGYINNGGSITKCISDGNTITSTGGEGMGGIVGGIWSGENIANVSKCYTTETTVVSSSYYEVGGIAGYNYGIISECFNKGNVNCSKVTIGGIAGGNYNTIINCYNVGHLKLTGSDTIGGIAGYGNNNLNVVDKAIIQNCYNVGIIEAGCGEGSKGGIIGNGEKASTCINSYWLDTCGVTKGSAGYGYGEAGCIKKSSDQIKQLINSSETLGDAYIADEGNINNGYPILKWQLED